jgi:hypothetical protein
VYHFYITWLWLRYTYSRDNLLSSPVQILFRALFLSDKTLTRARGSVEPVNVTRCAQRDISTGGSEVGRALSDVYAMVEDKESV